MGLKMMRYKHFDPPAENNCAVLTGIFWWHQVLDKTQMMVNGQSRVSHYTFYCEAQPKQEQRPVLMGTLSKPGCIPVSVCPRLRQTP